MKFIGEKVVTACGTLQLGPKVANVVLKDVYLHFGYIVDMIQLIHNKTHSSCSFMYKVHFSGDFMSNHLPALGFEPLAFHLSEIFLTNHFCSYL